MINHLGTVTIHSTRLTLRKFTISDVRSAHKNWMGDDITVGDIDFACHEKISETEEFIMDSILNYGIKNYNFAIELKKTAEIIGGIQLCNNDDYIKKCYVGFVLGKNFWRKGYMSEALETIFNFAFKALGYNKIIGLCKLDNKKSESLMQKLNMKFEGIARKEIRISDEFFDAKVYSILKEEFFDYI